MGNDAPSLAGRLLSIGHSNHSMEKFIQLLRMHHIEVLVDVRSHPYSKYASHFDAQLLEDTVAGAGIRYLSLGRELGGRPEGSEFYDETGHVLYSRVAQSLVFQEGIARLENGIRRFRVAIMCSEEDPSNCHRRLLIGRVLAQRGVALCHIRADGRLQTEEELSKERSGRGGDTDQLPLFDGAQEIEWKSTRSVLQKRQQPNSSVR